MIEQSRNGTGLALGSACFFAIVMIAMVGNYHFRDVFGDIREKLPAFSVERSCKPLSAPYGVYWYDQEHDFKPITKEEYISLLAAAKAKQQESSLSFSIQNELYGC